MTKPTQAQIEAAAPKLKCVTCGRHKRKDCDGNGWLDAIGPCLDGSYITSRPCPNENPFAVD